MKEPELERGTWYISEWERGRIVIQSNDFYRDAALELSGDFGDGDAKRRYAQAIVDALNRALPIFIAPTPQAQE